MTSEEQAAATASEAAKVQPAPRPVADAIAPKPVADAAPINKEAPAAPVPEAPVADFAGLSVTLRNRAVTVLTVLRGEVPDHDGDVHLGGLNGDLDCAIANLKPKG